MENVYTLLAVCALKEVFTKVRKRAEISRAPCRPQTVGHCLRGDPARSGSRGVCAHIASKVYIHHREKCLSRPRFKGPKNTHLPVESGRRPMRSRGVAAEARREVPKLRRNHSGSRISGPPRLRVHPGNIHRFRRPQGAPLPPFAAPGDGVRSLGGCRGRALCSVNSGRCSCAAEKRWEAL